MSTDEMTIPPGQTNPQTPTGLPVLGAQTPAPAAAPIAEEPIAPMASSAQVPTSAPSPQPEQMPSPASLPEVHGFKAEGFSVASPEEVAQFQEPSATPDASTPSPDSFEVASPALDREMQLQALNGYDPEEAKMAAAGDHAGAHKRKVARIASEEAQTLKDIYRAKEESDIPAQLLGIKEQSSNPAKRLVNGDPLVTGAHGKIVSGYGTAHLRGILNRHIAEHPSTPDAVRGIYYNHLMGTLTDGEITAKQRAINFDFTQVIAGEVVMSMMEKIGQKTWDNWTKEAQLAAMKKALKEAGIDPEIALKAKDIGEFFTYTGNAVGSFGDLIPVGSELLGTNRASDRAVITLARAAVANGQANAFQTELVRQEEARDLLNEFRGNTLAAGAAGFVKGTIPFFIGVGLTKPFAGAARQVVISSLERAAVRATVNAGVKGSLNLATKTTIAAASRLAAAGAGYAPMAAAGSIVNAELRHQESGGVESFAKAWAKETASSTVDVAANELAPTLKITLGVIAKTAFKYGSKTLPPVFSKSASTIVSSLAKASAKTRIPLVKYALHEVGFSGPVNIATMEIGNRAKQLMGLSDYHAMTGQELMEMLIGFSIPGLTEHAVGGAALGFGAAMKKYGEARANGRKMEAAKLESVLARAAEHPPVATTIEAQKERVAEVFENKEEFMSPEGLAATTVVAPDLVDSIVKPDVQPTRKVMPGNGMEGWRFTNEDRIAVQKELRALADAQEADKALKDAAEAAKAELKEKGSAREEQVKKNGPAVAVTWKTAGMEITPNGVRTPVVRFETQDAAGNTIEKWTEVNGKRVEEPKAEEPAAPVKQLAPVAKTQEVEPSHVEPVKQEPQGGAGRAGERGAGSRDGGEPGELLAGAPRGEPVGEASAEVPGTPAGGRLPEPEPALVERIRDVDGRADAEIGHAPGHSPDGDGAGAGVSPAEGSSRSGVADGGRIDHVIGDADALGEGGAKTKVRQNLAALKLLQRLAQEGRLATPEEQRVLAKYTGWGAFPNMFYGPKGEMKAEWKDLADELRELAHPKAYEAMRASTLNAHYTAPDVVHGMWDGLAALGFKGGRVLEPAMGTGNFFGMMPREMREVSSLHGVEMDPMTAILAKNLYQRAQVDNLPFQDVEIADGRYDLVVSNVPFGSFSVVDNIDRDLDKLNAPIHDYFFAKAIKKARPGGIVAMITSHFSLDKKGTEFRKAWNELGGEFMGAVRLPETAFKGNAGTEVVTDILVFKKRAEGVESKTQPYFEAWKRDFDGTTQLVNEYFVRHPENILGKQSSKGTMYGGEQYTVESTDINLRTGIRDAMARIAGVITAAPERTEPLPAGEAMEREMIDAMTRPDVQDGELHIEDGKVYLREGGNLVRIPYKTGEKAIAARLAAGLRVADVLEELIAVQRDPKATDKKVERVRRELNELYDEFVEKYGHFNGRYNVARFKQDIRSSALLALEKENVKTESYDKEAIFTKRTERPHIAPTSAETPADALAASLSEKGKVDLAYMSDLLGGKMNEDQIVRSLGRKIIWNSQAQRWESADVFLSGDTVTKLADAEAANAVNPSPRLAGAIEALRENQPTPVAPEEIDTNIGVPWIPASDYQQFLRETFGVSDPKLTYDAQEGVWAIEPMFATNHVQNESTYGIPEKPGVDIFDAIMRKKDVTVYSGRGENRTVDQEKTIEAESKMAELKAHFNQWMFLSNANRSERLSKLYNEKMNRFVKGKFDGSHLMFPGMNPEINLKGDRNFQANAVWRFLTTGNTLLAHSVGAGKTYSIAAMVMEGKRMGRFQRPVVSVPNHLIEQFPKEFQHLYPAAKIMVIDPSMISNARDRRTMVNRINTGSFDVVVCPASVFERIPVSEARRQKFFDEQIAAIENQMAMAQLGKGSDRNYVKQLEAAKQRLMVRLDRLSADWKKDDGFTFDNLGFDAMFVDEAHEYKNLYFFSQMGRVRGVGADKDTQRSFDMLMKTNYLNEMTGSKNVMFATGTPIANSVSEMHTMMRYMAPNMLEQAGLKAFDAWATTFGKVSTDVGQNTTGTGVQATKGFYSFTNIPELMQQFWSFADVVTADDLRQLARKNKGTSGGYNRPEIKGGKPIHVVVKKTAAQDAYLKTLLARIDAVRAKKPLTENDNMLAITTDGRKMALDMRLIDPSAPVGTSKLAVAAEKVAEIWKRTADDKSTQLIWADGYQFQESATNEKGKRVRVKGGEYFNLFHAMADQLVEFGIPREQVAFIGDWKDNRDELFEKVRTGEIRVLMGTTPLMGTGVNVQNRLIAAHHLDAPYRPDQMEQRDGRIDRQGNRNSEVEIYRYLTKGSFDAYIWELLEKKSTFINQVMSGKFLGRTLEDVGEFALTASEAKAAAAENPLMLAFVRLKREVASLASEARAAAGRVMKAKNAIDSIPARMDNLAKQREEYLRAADLADATRRANTVKNKAGKDQVMPEYQAMNGLRGYSDKMTEREQIAQAIERARVITLANRNGEQVVGRFLGADLSMDRMTTPEGVIVLARLRYPDAPGASAQVELGDNADGNVTRLMNGFQDFGSMAHAIETNGLGRLQAELEVAQANVGKVWGKEEQLAKASKEFAEVYAKLKEAPKPKVGGVDMNMDGFDDVAVEVSAMTLEAQGPNSIPFNPGANPMTDDRAVVGGDTGQAHPTERTMKAAARIARKDMVSAPDIIHAMKGLFDVSIFAGKTKSRKAAGEYSWGEDQIVLIRARTGDLGVAVHEIFHAVDRNTDMSKGLTFDMKKELQKLDYEPEKGRVEEGFAEFWRIYLTQGEAQARAAAPMSTGYFENWLKDKENRAIDDAIKSTQMLIRKYSVEQGARERILASVKTKKGGMAGIVEDIAGVGAKENVRGAATYLYELISDSTDALRRFDRLSGYQVKPGELTTKEISDYRRGQNNHIAEQWAEHGVETMVGEGGDKEPVRMPSGATLKDVLNGLDKQARFEFDAYLAADHLTEAIPQGYGAAGITIQDARRVAHDLEVAHPDFVRRAETYRKYMKDLVDVQVDFGLISPQQAGDIIGRYKQYTPMQRDIKTDTGLVKHYMDGGNGTAWRRRSQTGSGENIISPLQVACAETARVVARVQNQMVINQMVKQYHTAFDARKSDLLGEMIRELPMSWVEQHVNTAHVVEELVKAHVPREAFDAIAKKGKNGETTYDPEALAYWVQNWGAYDQFSNVLRVMDTTGQNRVPKFYAVDKVLLDTAHMARDLTIAKAISIQKQPPGVRLLFKAMSSMFTGVAKVVRVGAVTVNPPFAINHFVNSYTAYIANSDQLGLTVAQASWRPFAMLPAALGGELRETFGLEQVDPYYIMAQKVGLKNATMTGGDVRQKANAFMARMQTEGDRVARAKQLATSPGLLTQKLIATVGGITAISDIMTRLAVMRRAYEMQGISRSDLESMLAQGKVPSYISTVKAINAAADTSINFGKRGRIGGTVSSVIPFAAAHVAAIDNAVRSLMEVRKDGQWNKRKIAHLATLASYIAVGTTIYWWLRKDDDDYKQMPGWAKNRGLFITDSNGSPVLEIPRGRGLVAAVSHGVEGALNAIWGGDHGDAAKEAVKNTLRDFTPPGLPDLSHGVLSPATYLNSLPSALKPVMAVDANFDPLTGAPIIREHEKHPRQPELEYNAKTSPFMRSLAATAFGKSLGISPIKADYLMNNWTGGEFARLLGGNATTAKALIPMLARIAPTKAPKEFYDRKQVLDDAKVNEKNGGAALTEAQKSEAYRLDHYAEALAALRKAEEKVRDADAKFEYEKFLVGAAMLANGDEPLKRYPNPFPMNSGVPQDVRDALNDLLVKKIRAAVKPEPAFQAKRKKDFRPVEQVEESREAWQIHHDAAVKILKESGLSREELRDLWLDARKPGKFTKTDMDNIRKIMNLPVREK